MVFCLSDSNRFNKKLKDTEAIERDKVVLEVELQDQTAEAVWSFNGQPIVPNERWVFYYFEILALLQLIVTLPVKNRVGTLFWLISATFWLFPLSLLYENCQSLCNFGNFQISNGILIKLHTYIHRFYQD